MSIKQNLLLVCMLIGVCCSIPLSAQIAFGLQLVDEAAQAIPYASIDVSEPKKMVVLSDSVGVVSLRITKPAMLRFTIRAVSYSDTSIRIFVTKDTSVRIALQSNSVLNEVTIQEKKYLKSSSSSQEGILRISKNTLDVLPNIGGEKDVLRALQLLPGVQSGNEGTRGVFVRGGSPDQTLLLLDHTPVYNATHLYGFMSVFNGEAIDQVELYKNNFPARYGGRLGAVVDIKSNYGNAKKITASISLGLLSSRLHVEGPIGKNKKTTFSFSGRAAYVGLYSGFISKMQFKKAGYDGKITYNFYDMQLNIAHRFNERNALFAGTFYSQDLFLFQRNVLNKSYPEGLWNSQTQYKNDVRWRNNTFHIRWEHQYSKALKGNILFYISNYFLKNNFVESDSFLHNSILETYKQRNFERKNSIADYSLRAEWNYIYKQNELICGVQTTYRPYQIGKGRFTFVSNDKAPIDTTYNAGKNRSLENTIFIENIYKPISYFTLNAGFHIVHYTYNSNHFVSFQPRVYAMIEATRFLTIRASVISSTQNLHMLTSGSALVLTDLWVPATQKLKPENGWQCSGGLQFAFLKQFQFSVDGYYRRMNNVIEYKNGVNRIVVGDTWEDKILSGTGTSYGAEFYLSKTKGKLTAWAKYNLGWTYRQFTALNNGQKFYYKYDRRHDVSMAVSYKINHAWDISLTWVYATGNWMSLWKTKYASTYTIDFYNSSDDNVSLPFIVNNNQRNNYRLPSYHHLDIGCNYTKTRKKTAHILNISIYNVYNNFNVFDVFNDTRRDAQGNVYYVTKAITLFPILPSIMYTLQFK